LIEFDEKFFQRLSDELRNLLAKLGPVESHVIPISARLGNSVSTRSSRMRWYNGPTVLEALNKVGDDRAPETGCFRFPVQSVNRSVEGQRVYCGLISAGGIQVGKESRYNLPGRKRA
jgi:sulfate adenylyltransferase subunit 1 (EFTu-like GTPase family)